MIHIFINFLRALIPLLQVLLQNLEQQQALDLAAPPPLTEESETSEAVGTPSTSIADSRPECRHCKRKARPDADVCTWHLNNQERRDRGVPSKTHGKAPWK